MYENELPFYVGDNSDGFGIIRNTKEASKFFKKTNYRSGTLKKSEYFEKNLENFKDNFNNKFDEKFFKENDLVYLKLNFRILCKFIIRLTE